jgi:hypothetical protein
MDSVQVGQSAPGIRSDRTYTPREVLWSENGRQYLPAGVILDGSKARDALNTGDLSTLRPGMVLGKITSGGKYAPTILGVTTVAVLSGATTVTVSAATATEIVRRIGATGTNAIKVVGPPTAAGTVAATAVTHSAVNTTTGVITISATAVAIVTNSLITAADGSETPKGILNEFLRCTDVDGNDLTAVQVGKMLVAGFIDEAQIINWPADTSTRTYLLDLLNTPKSACGPFLAKGNF